MLGTQSRSFTRAASALTIQSNLQLPCAHFCCACVCFPMVLVRSPFHQLTLPPCCCAALGLLNNPQFLRLSLQYGSVHSNYVQLQCSPQSEVLINASHCCLPFCQSPHLGQALQVLRGSCFLIKKRRKSLLRPGRVQRRNSVQYSLEYRNRSRVPPSLCPNQRSLDIALNERCSFSCCLEDHLEEVCLDSSAERVSWSS